MAAGEREVRTERMVLRVVNVPCFPRRYETALSEATSNEDQIRTHKLTDIGERYLAHLMDSSDYNKVGMLRNVLTVSWWSSIVLVVDSLDRSNNVFHFRLPHSVQRSSSTTQSYGRNGYFDLPRKGN